MYNEIAEYDRISKQLCVCMNGARLVKCDEEYGVFLAWFGGHQVHAYDCKGTEIGIWSIGDYAKNSATFDEVENHMIELLDSKIYCNC